MLLCTTFDIISPNGVPGLHTTSGFLAGRSNDGDEREEEEEDNQSFIIITKAKEEDDDEYRRERGEERWI